MGIRCIQILQAEYFFYSLNELELLQILWKYYRQSSNFLVMEKKFQTEVVVVMFTFSVNFLSIFWLSEILVENLKISERWHPFDIESTAFTEKSCLHIWKSPFITSQFHGNNYYSLLHAEEFSIMLVSMYPMPKSVIFGM